MATFKGTAGDDTLTGTSGNDKFNLTQGGNDTAFGGDGNDVFTMGATLTATDSIDGGVGTDTVTLKGDYSAGLIFAATTIVNIEKLQLFAGFNYNLTTNDANVGAGDKLIVNGGALKAGNFLVFDGSAETDGGFAVTGGAGNDVLTGGALRDVFTLTKGGDDTVHGGGGNDTFNMGAALTATDKIDGGTGNDVLQLAGDYSAGLTFGAATATGIETVQLATGHNYNLTTNDATVAAGATMTVDGSALGPASHLVFNGGAETDGSFNIIAGASADTLTGGALADSFDLSHGGNDVAHGGGGNDTFTMGAALTAADQIDGGTGNDVVTLNGDYSAGVAFSATTIVNVETLRLLAGHSYTLTANDATVAAGAALTVDAGGLGAADMLTFNGGAETDGRFVVTGGAGNDTITGGAQGDSFDLSKGGSDIAHGGGGSDTFTLGATLTASDQIDGGTGSDTLTLAGDYSAGITFGATTIASVETLKLTGGNSYTLTTNDANVASGTILTVDGGGLGASAHIVFNGGAETDGSFAFIGGAGADTLTGGAQADGFDLSRGGNDIAHGGGGNDAFSMGAALTAADQVDGGTGSDTLILSGDYSAGVTFVAATMTNVETLQLAAGNSYALTLNNANVAAGQTLTVDASALGSANHLTFNGAAETDGSFALLGGAGDDALTGGALADSFDLSHGGNDIAHGGGGNDSFSMGAALTATDQIDGGAGSDTLILNGDYSAGVAFGAATVTNVETIQLAAGHGYNLTTDDATVAGGLTLTVDATALGSGNALTFNGAAETDGSFAFVAGAGNDALTGGGQADSFDLSHGGNDTAHGGAGNDTFTMGAAFTAADQIDGGTGSDTLILNGDYSAGLTFTAATMANVETLKLTGGNGYSLTLNDANVAAGQVLSVDASALGGSAALTFNGTAESNGSFAIVAGAGNDTLTGGSLADSFDLSHGGNDTAHGGGGTDTFVMGAAFTALDHVDGGAGNDVMTLNGDYSAGVVFGATTLTNVETLQVAAGHSYNLAENDANLLSGAVLTVDGSALGAGDALVFNGGVETDGSFAFIGGAGADTLTGGLQADTFDLSQGGADTAHGGGGNDTFTLGAALTAGDAIDGGAGSDVAVLNGDYSAGLTLGAATLTGIETLRFTAGHSYSLTANDGNVAAGSALTVDASALGASDALAFNGAAETDGSFAFVGGAGSDTLTGGAQADTFDLSHGGADTAQGGGGNDTFNAGAAFTSADSIDGGAGIDTLVLNGDYSAGLALGAATIANIETLQFTAGHSYALTTDDGNVAAAGTLTVDGSGLGAGDVLTFDGSCESDGSFAIAGGAGSDVLTGGGQGDVFDLSHGGNDTAHGGGGNDSFNMGAALTASDRIDGGTGNDTLTLNGDYSSGLTLGAATLTGVETLQLAAGHSYGLTTNDANVAAGQTLTVDGSALTVSDALVFNGAAESDGSFIITGGFGGDTLTGGAQADTFDLSHGGSDTAHGGAGNDTFVMGAALNSADAIDGGTGSDVLTLNGDYSSALQLGAGTLTSVETLQLAAGHSYDLITNDANVASGQSMTVDAGALGAGDTLQFDGASESDGSFAVIGGAGNDVLFGGAQADSFDLGHGGNDTAHGGGGSDTFNMGAALGAADVLDGGAGNDTVVLNGDYSAGLTLGAGTLTSIETLQFAAGHSYNLAANNGNVAAGLSLTVDGSALGAGDTLTFNGAAESDGSFALIGGAGSDALTGGAQADSFDLSLGGADAAHGGGGNDTFTLGAAMSAADTIDGGTGTDTLVLNGDYSGGLTLGASSFVSIETLQLLGGHSYGLVSNDANVAAGTTLTVDAGALGASDSLNFDGSAESDGSFAFIGGAGGDVLAGGAQADSFDLSHGGSDTAMGNGGNDTFNVGAALSAGDSIDGGAGNDTLVLNGDYSGGLALGASTIANVETVQLAGGHSYNLTSNDGNVAAGATLAIDASALAAGTTLTFNGASETDGSFTIIGGAGNDTLTGGAQADTFDLSHGGNDTAHGGSGSDTFDMGAAFTAADRIDGGAGNDTLVLDGDYSSGLTLGASTLTSVETIAFAFGNIYTVTANAATVPAGGTMTIDASALGAGDTLNFNGAPVTNGSFAFIGGAGNDVITGGNDGNTFDLSEGGTDLANGGQGVNVFDLGATLDSSDRINGAIGGTNILVLNGSYFSLAISNSMVANMQTVEFQGTNTTSVTWVQQPFSAMTIDASAAGGSLTFDFSAVSQSMHFIGGALNTHIVGGSAADTFDAGSQTDNFAGNGGNDIFNFGANFTAADQVDGGTGSDVLNLNGDYSAGLTFGATTMVNVETLSLAAGHDYSFTTVDANVASGQTLTVDASALGSGNHLTLNGAAETDGFFSILGGAGSDTVTFAGNLTAGDHIDGGAGSDTLVLNGDYAGLTLGATTVVNVETIQLGAGHSYNIATNDATVASGQTLTVDASALGGSNGLTFSGATESNGSFAFIGGSGNDTLTGGALADTFDLSEGGTDTAHGGNGNDVFNVGQVLNNADAIDGGTGNDTLILNGDYSGGFTFGDTTLTSIETLQFAAGHSYNITASNLSFHNAMTIDASALGAGDSLTFNGTSAGFALTITGGAGNDAITAGSSDDIIDLSHGGTDTVNAFQGNDTINAGAAFSAADSIDGGTGTDTLVFNGDYTGGVVFGAATVVNVEKFQFTAGHSYNITIADATVGNGLTLTVDGSALGAGDSLVFNGSADTDGALVITGGAGNDVITGGHRTNTFDLTKGGNDTVHAVNGGTINMGATLTAADVIDGGAGSTLNLNGDYSAGLVFGATTATNIVSLNLAAGHDYNLTLNDAMVIAGTTMQISAAPLSSANHMTIDASAELHGFLKIAGGNGADTITFGANFVAADTISGGSGSDTLVLDGDYGAFTFGATTMTSIATLSLGGGHSYNLTTDDATVAGSQTLTVDASALGAGDVLTLNGSAETNGTFHVIGGAGNDVLQMGAHLVASDQYNGGAGSDTLMLNGDYSVGLTLGAATLTSVETLQLAAAHSYNLTLVDGNVAAGATLTIDATALGAANAATINAAAETDGNVVFEGGAGNDNFTIGGNITTGDVFNGGAGSDTLTLAGGIGSPFTFSSTQLVNVETLAFAAGHNYDLVMSDQNVAAGQTLNVNASALGTNDNLTFDFSAETDGFYNIMAGKGHYTIDVGGALKAGDTINGNNNGGAISTVEFNGDYSSGLVLSATTIVNVDEFKFDAGHSYNITVNDATLNQAMNVDASALGAGDTFIFNATAETVGNYTIFGGAGDDTITTGKSSSYVDVSQGGDDTVHLGTGGGTIVMGSNWTANDSIDGGKQADLFVDGTYSSTVMVTPGMMANIARITLFGTFSGGVTFGAGCLPTGGSLLVDFAQAAGTALSIDASALTNDHLTFNGGNGNDTLVMGAAFVLGVNFNGNGGTNEMTFNGDYSTKTIFSGTSFVNVQTLLFAGGHSYNFQTDNGNVAAGQTVTVDASGLGAGDVLTFNAAAETNGSYDIVAGAGNDVLTGGSFGTIFDLTHGGTDTAHGGTGADTFNLGATFTAADTLSGGGGADVLNLNGDYSAGVVFGATTVTTMATIALAAGNDYNLTTNDATVASAAKMTVDASALGASDDLVFNGAAETNGTFTILAGAGSDTLTGGAGNDTFTFGAHLTAADTVNGGGGTDTLNITGDYTLSLGGGHITGIEDIVLGAGHSYSIVTDDTVVAAGATLIVDGGTNNVTQLIFDGSAETDGKFNVVGGSGNDTITTGAGNDVVDITKGGNDTVSAGAGNDTISVGSALTSADSIDGGAGIDTVQITAGFTGSTGNIANIEVLQLTGTGYNITFADVTVAAGATLTIDASAMTAAITLNGAAETDGSFAMTGGSGNDVLTGGAMADTFDLSHGGNDTVHAGGGDDTFTMGTGFNTSDTLDGGAGNDTLVLAGSYNGLSLFATTITGIEKITCTAISGDVYSLAFQDANVAAGATLTIDGSALLSNENFLMNGGAETDGHYVMIAGAGLGNLTGGALSDTFDMSRSSTWNVHGNGGDDITYAGALFQVQASIFDTDNGGTGTDTLVFTGDYSAGMTFLSNSLISVEVLQFSQGFSYKFTTVDGDVAAGASMTVDGSALLAANTLTFNGGAETDGTFAFIGGAGNDVLTGGALADTFDLTHGGNDTAHGGGGADTFYLGATMTTSDVIDGGGGGDILVLNGDYSTGLTINSTDVTSLTTIQLTAGHNYNITFASSAIQAGVDGSALGASDTMTVDASAQASYGMVFIGGSGNDVLVGGALSDNIDLSHGGTDTVTGGGGGDTITAALTGNDTFVFNAVSDSTGTSYDTISQIDFGSDLFKVSAIGAVTGVDTAVTTGALSTATFNTDLAGDIGAGQLAAHHAVLFTADSGTLAGHTFLIVDENGTAGYQSGADLVIDVTGAVGTLTASGFI
jgi:Ca2+-binding RTX toxin-like protein